MIQAVGQLVPLKLDVDKNEVKPIAAKYDVSAIPAIFVMDADGKVVGTVTASTPAQFASDLDRIVKSHGGVSGAHTTRRKARAR